MISLTVLPLFLLASWTLNIAPGPDMLYVIARSAGQGRLAGLVSALHCHWQLDPDVHCRTGTG